MIYTTEELKHLSKEELQIIFCDFFNEIDKTFLENRNSCYNNKDITIMELYNGYLKSAQKAKLKIKKSI